MKALRIIFVILLSCLLANNALAKEGKIKYSKFIEYQGAVTNKAPDGRGSLTISSIIDKKKPLVIVTGTFHKGSTSSENIVVSDVQLKYTSLEFSGAILNLDISKEKESETINLQFPECKITDAEYIINSDDPLSISLKWNKQGDKEWKNVIESSNTGSISSNFVPVPQIMSGLGGLNEIIVQEVVNFDISIPKPSYQKCSVIITNVQEVLFDSGLKVKLGSPIVYTFPNGNYTHYDSNGLCSKLHSKQSDGEVSYDGSTLSITYKNGDKFEAENQPHFNIRPDHIGGFNPLKELKLSGVYKKVNKSIDIYYNGNVVERRILGGTILMGSDSKFCIKFDNGNIFSGTGKTFIKNYTDFLNFTSVDDAILNNGKLSKTSEVYDVYRNGMVVGGCWILSDGGYVEYVDNVPVNVKYPDGSIATGEFVDEISYNSNRSSKEYKLKDGTKTFANGLSAKIIDCEVKPSNYSQIKLMALEEGLDVTVYSKRIFYVWDEDERMIGIEYHPEFQQLNDGNYYIPINDMGLSYPKSYISKKSGNGFYKYLTHSHPIGDELDPDDMQLVWVYKSKGCIKGKDYGITKALYVINRETDEVVYDLTSDIKSGHNRSFYYVQKLRQYHDRGRVEKCGLCLGTGRGWQGGFCPNCGGKGWYIEHYW